MVTNILAGEKSCGATTEIVILGDLRIKECNECHVCWSGKECTKADDMWKLHAKVAESDAIIFATRPPESRQ